MNGGQNVHDNAGLGRGLDLEMNHNTYTHRIDDYTRNSLNSFSFGNVKLVTPADEDDEEGENISPTTTTIDVTPRPSVVSTDFPPYAGSSRLSTSSRLSPTPSPSSFVSEADTRTSHLHDVEFSSDDDSYEFDHLDYPEDDENIEISSARFSVGTGYISNGYGPPAGYRDREGSIATLKTLRRATSNSLVDTNGQPSIFTSPFESSSPVTETVLAAAPTSSTSLTDAPDTDFDFAYITSFGADISPDFVRRPSAISISAPNRDQSHTPRKNSLGNSLFLSWLPGRRPSTATVASVNSTSNMFLHDDSFAKGLLNWGGDMYREQRKDWTFRREAHSESKGKEVAIPSPKSVEVKEEPVRVRTSSSTSRATPAMTTTSIATDTDDSTRESNGHTTSQKEREKERLKRSTLHWRGMSVGSEETWSNGLLGDWNVQREDVGRNGKSGRDGDSSKGPQQRLLIRFRGDSLQNTEVSPKADADHLHLPHPPITVHKHSKAMAFSLTRFHKTHSNYPSPSVHGGRPSTSSAGLVPPHLPSHFSPSGASSVSRTAGSKVILLAPRRVQEAFTSTTTTKMLAEHGLLGNGGGDMEKEARRRKSVGGEGTSSLSSPNKVRRKMSLNGPVSQASSGSPEVPPVPPLPSPSTSVSHHGHSPFDTSQPPIPTAPTVSETPYLGPPTPTEPETVSTVSSPTTTLTATSSPTSPVPSIPPYTSENLLVSHRTSSYTENTENTDRSSTLIDSETSETSASDASSASDATSASSHLSPSVHRRRGRKWYNGRNGNHNENETDESSFNEDDDELEHSRIIRTPHSEAYGTVDFSVLDRQRVLQSMSEPSISSSSSSTSPFSLLERFINRNGIRSGVVDTLDPSASALRATAGPAFDPPWLTFPSRGKQEQQRRVVSNLNTSFKDVGLLPSSPRVSSHGRRGSRVGVDSGASKSSSSSGSVGGRRKSVGGKGSKSGRKPTSDPSKDVFSSVPPESLCMLLPLWPGDTDPPSHRGTHDYPPTRKVHIPPERKTFLLVWYKALDPQVEKEKGKRDGRDNAKSNDDVALAVIDTLIGFSPKDEKEGHDRKEKDKKDKKDKKNKAKGVSSGSGRESGKESGKSSHGSPTSSNDGSGFLRSSRSLGSGLGRSGGTGTSSATQSGSHSVNNLTWAQVHANDDRNILLPGFLITARQVSYRDLQGTGVRVPDEGLTVNGPMDEAWREYNAGGFIDPGTPGISSFMPDPTLLAVCHSRESGVEFDPEALVSLSLCRVLNPLPMGMVAEDFTEENADGTRSSNNGTDKEGPKNSWGLGASKLKLTPVGRSVMELCWVGGLSLMSFGPG